MLTLHDVQHLDLPELFPRGERPFVGSHMTGLPQRAAQVIVISELVRAARSTGSGSTRRGSTRSILVSTTTGSPRPGGEREPFLHYPARPWGTRTTLACSRRSSYLRGEPPGAAARAHGGPGTSVRCRPVSRRAAASRRGVDLYRRAAALVFPSLYEGFGLPPSRRWRAAARWRRRRAGSLPEVVGTPRCSSTRTTPRRSPPGSSEALERAAELAARPRARRRFTWDATARAHDRVYELASSLSRAREVRLDHAARRAPRS